MQQEKLNCLCGHYRSEHVNGSGSCTYQAGSDECRCRRFEEQRIEVYPPNERHGGQVKYGEHGKIENACYSCGEGYSQHVNGKCPKKEALPLQGGHEPGQAAKADVNSGNASEPKPIVSQRFRRLLETHEEIFGPRTARRRKDAAHVRP